jgi:gliding motility-associated-like protein
MGALKLSFNANTSLTRHNEYGFLSIVAKNGVTIRKSSNYSPICTDLIGNMFITGFTSSTNFPLLNAGTFFQATFGGGILDAFILKFSNTGNLLFATYYGDSDDDIGYSICTDTNGNVFVSGYTVSANFPLQNAGTFFQGTFGGGLNVGDAFILKFDNIGNRLWATLYGGTGSDYGYSIRTDLNGNLFVTGNTDSPNFPILNAGTFFQATFGGGNGDAFILKFDNNGNRLWATYFGGSAMDLCSPYAFDNIAIDNCDNVYINFLTTDISFPHLINNSSCSYFDNSYNGDIADNIIAQFTNNGNLNWCSYVGGNGYDEQPSLAVDINNNLFTTGFCDNLTNSATYPLANPNGGAYFDNTFNGLRDFYIVKFSYAPLSYTISSLQASACNACDGSATFSISCGEAPYSFVWSNGISVLNTTLNTSSITNLCPGVYNVTVTSGCTQTVAQSYTINGGAGVAIIPTASVLPSNSLCPGQSLTLTSVAATSHTWAGPNNFLSNLQDPTLTNLALTNAGVYTVNVTSADGCVSSTTVNLVVNPLPTVSASLSNSPCQGQNVILVGTSNVVAFQWSGPNNFSSNLQNPTLTNLQLNNAGVYTLNVTSTNGCVNSATVNLVVNPPPTVSASVSNSNACQGQNVSLNGTSNAAIFQWAGPSNYNSAVQSPTLTNVALNNSGVYTLNVTSASGCVNSTTVSLVVNPLPTVSASLSNSACQGQSLSLVGTSTATNFQWSGPNNFVSNQQSPTLTNLQLNNNGVYTLNVTSANGCVNSATVSLVVNPLPSVLASASSSSACQGQSLSLNGTSNAATLQWAGPNNFASNLQNPTLTNVALNNSGVYTLNATSASGCVNATTVNLVVNPTPTVFASSSNSSACQGQSVSLSGTSTATTFQWAGTNNYSSDLQSPTLTNLQLINAGVYTLNATSANGCINSATVNLVVIPLPSVSASLSNIPCFEQNVSLVGTSNANSYQWTGPNNFSSSLQNPLFTNLQFNYNGVYILNVTSASGCFNSTSIILQVNPQPTVSASASSSSACQGQSVSLVASGNATVFQWSGPNNFSSTSQTVSIQNLQLNQSGVYNLSVTSLQGCTNTTTINFTVNPNPQAVILSQAVSACPPLCASYSFVPTTDVASYSWLLPSSNTIANTPTIQTCYTTPGDYTMQLDVKGTNGCVAKGNYSLQVYPKPIADFVFNPTNPTVNEDDVVTFKDVTGYGAPTQWAWYFLTETKNTITKFGNEATYKYTEAGTYPVSLVVTNNFGCIDTVVKSIVVADDYGLFIPNAFTPNNDGTNDTFVPKGHGIKSYTLVIFNRWGEQLYKTNQFESGWDGYYKGELSKSDIYTWKINCVDVKNKSHELIGSFTLIK